MAILSLIIGFFLNSVKMFSWILLFWMAYLAVKFVIVVFWGIKADEERLLTYKQRFSKRFCRVFRHQISFCEQHKIIKYLILLSIPVAIVFCNSYAAHLIPFMQNIGVHNTFGTYYYKAILTDTNGSISEGTAKLTIKSYPFSLKNEIFLDSFNGRSNYSSEKPIYLNQNNEIQIGGYTAKCFVTVFPADKGSERQMSNGFFMDALSWWLLGFSAFGVIVYITILKLARKENKIATRPNKLKFIVMLYGILQIVLALIWIWGALDSRMTRWSVMLIPILLFCLCNGKPEEMQTANNQPGSPSADAD